MKNKKKIKKKMKQYIANLEVPTTNGERDQDDV